MAFYSPDAPMGERLASLVSALEGQISSPVAGTLAITWLRFPLPAPPGPAIATEQPLIAGATERIRPRGASWQGGRLLDPGALVALPCLIAVEQWLQQDRLQEEPELRRALGAMVQLGSCDALSHVVDRLSGTTSGPALLPAARAAWERQRWLVNDWLASLGWPELEGASACHKVWSEGPYGRDREFLLRGDGRGNRLSSDGLARLLLAVIAGELVSPPACRRLRAVLQRSTPPPAAEGCVPPRGWLARDLPADPRLWGLAAGCGAGVTEALYAELPGGPEPQLLVVLAGVPPWGAAPELLSQLGHDLLAWQPGEPSGAES